MVHIDLAGKQYAVCGHALAGLQAHHITHHQLGNGKGEQHPVPHNARLDALCILLHFAEGGFAAVFGNGGNQGGQRNGDGNAHGFKPILVAEKEDDVDGQRQ